MGWGGVGWGMLTLDQAAHLPVAKLEMGSAWVNRGELGCDNVGSSCALTWRHCLDAVGSGGVGGVGWNGNVGSSCALTWCHARDGVHWGVITLDQAAHLFDATVVKGSRGGYCLGCCMRSIPTPRCLFACAWPWANYWHLGRGKKQNPPCAHWAGDLVDWEIWEFQNTSFKKMSGFKIQLFSFKIPVAKYNCLVSK